MGNEIQLNLFFFLLSLGFGTFMFTPITNSKDTGVGFTKLALAVSGGSLLLAVLTSWGWLNATQIEVRNILLVNILFIIIEYLFHRDVKSLLMKVIYGFHFLSLLVISHFLFSSDLLANTHFILTSLMIGVVNYTMILGHYYLVVPRLSEKPLLISLKIMWFALMGKVLISLYQTYLNQEFFLEGTQIGFGYMYNWIMLSMRFLWGYVALFILSIFGYKLAKMRSIQSATGVFYIMVFFIIVGELISGYLNVSLGLKI